MAEAEQFSLRWNNFHSNLTEGFHSLLEEVDLVDVTLAADGQYLQAHKIVLSVCSPYFKQLFKANPCKHPIVILKDVCHKDLQALLQFMYQGEVNVRQEELAPFLKTAEMLQIKGLTGSDTKSKVPTDHVSESSLKPASPVQRIGRNVCKTETPSGAELSSPPFKRQRTSSPVVVRSHSPSPSAPLVDPLSSASTSHSLHTITETPSPEFVSVPEPKLEPLEYDAETEEMKDSPTELVQLLQSSESSQPSSEHPSAAPGLFSSVAGLPQDSGGSQDSVQGLLDLNVHIDSALVGRHMLVPTEMRSRSQHRVQKRCVLCYATYRKSMNSNDAAKKAKRISTYCSACPSNPFMCIKCFKEIHASACIENRDFTSISINSSSSWIGKCKFL